MQVTEVATLGSDTRHIRDRALRHVGGDALALLRTKTTSALLNWAADEAVRAARPRLRDDYQYASAGDVSDLIAHACKMARLPAAPHYRPPEQAHRRSGYDVVSHEKREKLEAVVAQIARCAADETEQSLAEFRSAALDEAETSGRSAAADLLVRDCASLLRHRNGVCDAKIWEVIENLRDFLVAAASSALDHRRRGEEAQRFFIANVAMEAIGEGGVNPSILISDTVGPRWRSGLAWTLLETMTVECWELPPARTP